MMVSHALNDAALTYKGDGDYDLVIGPVTLELSYDGSDYAVGEWEIWDLKIAGSCVRVSRVLAEDSELANWLEQRARASGSLPDEPEEAQHVA